MKQLKISRAELADKAKVSRGYVSDLLNGKRGGRLGGAVMIRLAAALEVEPIFLDPAFASPNRKQRRSRNCGNAPEGAGRAAHE